MNSTSSLLQRLALGLLLIATPISALAQQRGPAPARVQRATTKGYRAALMARLRGKLYTKNPKLLGREVKLTKKSRSFNKDATFQGTHPMFKRLVKSGWYTQDGKINALQKAADGLRKNRKIARSTPLSQVEVLSFDLEATSGRSGKFDKNGRFLNGYDEVMQFGYTVHKGGKVIERGSIPIRPDTYIPKPVAKLTGLDHKKLAKAPRFEQVAGKILGLMKGRVLLGQSAIQSDWSWLQSNFARIGVKLPKPKALILDTHLISYNVFPKGAGVKSMSEHYKLEAPGKLHDAQTDAHLTGLIFDKLMRDGRAKTLGDAFKLQHQGYVKQRTGQ